MINAISSSLFQLSKQTIRLAILQDKSISQSENIFPIILPLILLQQNTSFIMEESMKNRIILTNNEANIVKKYKERYHEIKEEEIYDKIIHRDSNTLDFYKITPKEQLPKLLQKMRFQTLHLKEKDFTNSIKVFRKENRKPEEIKIRKKIKAKGRLMLLSEIYQNFEQSDQDHTKIKKQYNLLTQKPNQLEEWEKTHKYNNCNKSQANILRSTGGQKQSRKGLRQGCDYKGEIQKGLELIYVTHGSEYNLINRYLLIENSSKLLKKDLDDRKLQVQENIKNRMKLLYEARIQYHNCFQQRDQLCLEERALKNEFKPETMVVSHNLLTAKTQQCQIRNLFDKNQCRISRTRKIIQGLEQAISRFQDELKKIMLAEEIYFRISLKNGCDMRESGLLWIIRKLQIKESNISHYEFPVSLDRRSLLFIIKKAQNEQQMELLLQEKRRFVNQIGRTTSEGKSQKLSILSPKELLGDRIVEGQFNSNNIPKKYRRSLKKFTALSQEFIKNCTLLQARGTTNKGRQISADLQGMTHKEIYEQVGERIKRLNLSKIKKDKFGSKESRLFEYQSLLEKIKMAHMKMEEMDLQHENYLLSHYRENRNQFFAHAASCFGYKRAYSMIIKYFSWNSYHQNNPNVNRRINQS